MSGDDIKPKFEDWAEWKRACAIDLCSDETKARLVGLVGSRLINLNRRCRGGREMPSIAISREATDARSAFHFFEIYMHEISSTTGKKWKEWLFHRARQNIEDTPEVAVEKIVSHCLRTEVLRRISEIDLTDTDEGRDKNIPVGSLDAPLDDSASSETLTEIINDTSQPDPADEAALKELKEIGDAEAAPMFRSLPWETKVAFLAACLALPVSNPDVCKAAGKGKSVLSTRLYGEKEEKTELQRQGRSFCPKIWQSIRLNFQTKYLNEDPRTLDLLADATLDSMGILALEWGKSEKRVAPLFHVAEQQNFDEP